MNVYSILEGVKYNLKGRNNLKTPRIRYSERETGSMLEIE
jgi:hypothetical protein